MSEVKIHLLTTPTDPPRREINHQTDQCRLVMEPKVKLKPLAMPDYPWSGRIRAAVLNVGVWSDDVVVHLTEM